MKTTRTRSLSLGAVLIAVVALTACGGSSSGSSKTTTTVASAQGNGAFFDCLAQHGASVPNGGPPGGGAPGSGAPNSGNGAPPPSGASGPMASIPQSALDACKSLQPSGGAGNPAGAGQSQVAAYQSCMKDNGIDLTNTTLDHTSAAFSTADTKCASLRPTPNSATTAAS